ncbi:hypothetical protein NEMBOFW57_001204 [Staphylotrichum longicolle]|uniref:Uncharacterized protein n=1 Tax=Staphylotrichum longicolle TaxID=669026 RepID=A0AAD4F114_9PEZI|nr:hypothetical protein NEMBOFW57_001204 [Staphylotrichum longicolle]
MEFTAPGPVPPSALPRLPGPKLAPFTPTAYADIEFIKELGKPSEDMDSFVWKVRINGMPSFYALKMLYLDYFDPFNCECRAYGRLQQESREDLAVRAHGYLMLTREQELEVAQRSGPINPGDEDDDDDDAFCRINEPLVSNRPVHAIVKDLVTDQDPFGPGQVDDMWDDLEGLHRLGILVRDIKVGNYLGGKLIDFSRAWTVPHPVLEHIYTPLLEEERQRDPDALVGCIADWGIENAWDFNVVKIPEELTACMCGKSENDRFGTDPRRYDWRRWEVDIEAVDHFWQHELYAPAEPDEEEEEKWCATQA